MTDTPEYFAAKDHDQICEREGVTKTFGGVTVNAYFNPTNGLFVRFNGLASTQPITVTCDSDRLNDLVHLMLTGDQVNAGRLTL